MTEELITQTKEQTKNKSKFQRIWRGIIGFIGADNLSLIFALIILVLLITIASPGSVLKAATSFLPGKTYGTA